MSSFIEYTYQHTCKNGQKAYVLQSSPFLSPVVKKRNILKIPFLGEGYYLWEENIDAAIRWGEKHYNNDYCIVEYKDVKIEGDDLLDFLNRRDMRYFNELKDIYIKKTPKCKNWALGTWIEFFKKMKKIGKENFPFNFIRAEENLPNYEENNKVKGKIFFADGVNYYTYSSPLLMICVIDKKKLNFKTQSIL
ncbi:hypothetical protein G1L02_02035 [Tenacibaculum finnmarkense]|uniref:hypothetical protein n=1 Tax=Tenacibaculum finnmarkense TaxID=2781243 RepID=UPI001EFB11B4|nr:hypothetical protein [Tenacibaculum finnmarkense]MCG8762515.1 hypothetical protein [Tenacibaculum finnmarkense]MCG8787733.1 hypothetical protein [Tenacibaculum finnmarkense]MCG8881942.1 hypothetical protein [Tenacibaculum finnmarkense]